MTDLDQITTLVDLLKELNKVAERGLSLIAPDGSGALEASEDHLELVGRSRRIFAKLVALAERGQAQHPNNAMVQAMHSVWREQLIVACVLEERVREAAAQQRRDDAARS